MAPQNKIDISENTLRNRGRVLDILLVDRTRHKTSRPFNIIWATDSYYKLRKNKDYAPTKQIKREQVTGTNGKLIQPRAAKSKEEQKYRTKDKAEVFTPLKIVKEMNMAINLACEHWPATRDNWVEYISEKRLEITCGEAPFIASRYDPITSKSSVEPVKKRVGFLDYKLRVVSEFTKSEEEWLEYAEVALKSCYGYEWQGDNLLIARENILLTVEDFYRDFCETKLKLKSKLYLPKDKLEKFAEIISWNIWQMDGLKMTLPYTGHNKKNVEENVDKGNTLFDINKNDILKMKKMACPDCRAYGKRGHKPIYAKIKDWETGRAIQFVKLLDQTEKAK